MRLKIETNETTKEKIGSALKGSFDARKDHMTREALRLVQVWEMKTGILQQE